MLVQDLFQPLVLAFVFGRIPTAGGMEANEYKNVLLPGTVCVCMLMSGVWRVAMPLIADPVHRGDRRPAARTDRNRVDPRREVLAGMIQALVAGLVVLPCAWVAIGPDVGLGLDLDRPWQFAPVCIWWRFFRAQLAWHWVAASGRRRPASSSPWWGRAPDYFRLRLLPVVVAAHISRAAICRPPQPAGLRQ